jgi:hypothetical protein
MVVQLHIAGGSTSVMGLTSGSPNVRIIRFSLAAGTRDEVGRVAEALSWVRSHDRRTQAPISGIIIAP